jgi:hypothetical protein
MALAHSLRLLTRLAARCAAQLTLCAVFWVGQDKFFTQLKNSADGFNVIAEFFGRGILNTTSTHT